MALHRSTSARSAAIAYGLLAGQLALLLLLVLWNPTPSWELPGWLDAAARVAGLAGLAWLALGILGLGRSASALPLPLAHGELKTGGLYRFSRHPIYTGLLVFAWAAAVARGSVGPLVIAGALTALLVVKAGFEEAALCEAYPGYAAYAARTPRFLPLGRS